SARILLTILEWKLFQNKIDMNVVLREKMNALRLVLAQTEPDPTLTTRVISQPFHMHPPSLLSVGMASGVNERIETRLNTRMGLHSPFDGIGIYSKYDFLKFMEFEIAIRRGIVQLERFLIFDQISTPPATFLSRRPSWRFVLGAQRYRQLPGNSLLSGITLGYGYAAQTFRKKISAALMLEAISGYSRKTGFNLLTEPVMRIGFFPFKRIRFYSELRATEDIRDKQWKFYPGSDISLTVDLNDHSRLRLSAELNQNANLLAIYLAHYLN
ncbi:MAG: hypothetical protein AAFP70_19255, partial [Calditrichota bacterium]